MLRCHGSLLPGVAPDEYPEGSGLEILAHKLTSDRTKIPFDYYALPFCHHDAKYPRTRINLGQLLMGERMRPTGYAVTMLGDSPCEVLCASTFSKDAISKLTRLVKNAYRVRLSLDNLPVVEKRETSSHVGYPLGVIQDEVLYFNNHIRFTILYHKVAATELTDDIGYRVVGFEASTFSVQHGPLQLGKRPATCDHIEEQSPMKLSGESDTEVVFTYDVVFKESDLQWVTRWDALQKAYPGRQKSQWIAIVNSSLLCLFLSTLIMLILLRTLRKDLVNSDLVGSDLDETGWKSLRRDVFRPPRQHVLLSVLSGTGVQLVVIVAITLQIALLGFLTPEYRGRLAMAAVTLWILTSALAGYTSARVHGYMDGARMRDVALGTAFIVPGFVFSVVFVINLLFWITGSIGGTPVPALFILLLLWFCISVPLCYIGAQIGCHRKRVEPTSNYSSIPREIPDQSFLFGKPLCVASGGLPFGVMSVELLFILNSLWHSEIYAMFGFLFFVFLVVLMVSAETSIVVTYVKLINEDHRWWWYAFLSPGTVGLYVFLYSLLYLFMNQTLDGMNLLSDIIVMSYMGVISVLLSVMIGSIGFLASFCFVNVIFSGLRVD
ncbi:hypothetical protein NDN08_004732 [Rhodosorus marinus]|uniref:Transmembrane 9 superfamily member n=1 Tax=Rhodosorus marinus TaxID=101924 RepID=A0AAV8UM46_9RHOD|nr:hypothetical protein NDN08_004732 [Rhodosorus marinus]